MASTCVLFLQGTVPEQLSALSHLRNLNLSSNKLTGSLPVSIGQLQIASGVWLDHNQFSGSIPDAWCNASVTSAVHVGGNPGLCREVPQCLQGRLHQGSGFAGAGLGQAVDHSTTDASNRANDGSSSSSSSSNSLGSNIKSSGCSSNANAEMPTCSSSTCGSVRSLFICTAQAHWLAQAHGLHVCVLC